MPDFLTPQERSKLMSKIRSRDTGPELKMAGILDRAGIAYERYADLPGTPDFVIGNVVVLCDGDFWHGRHFWKKRHKLKPFWFNKIMGNMRRDMRVDSELRSMGYRIVRIWETSLKNEKACLRRIKSAIAKPLKT